MAIAQLAGHVAISKMMVCEGGGHMLNQRGRARLRPTMRLQMALS